MKKIENEKELDQIIKGVDKKIEDELKKIDEIEKINSIKVLKAFHNNNLSYPDLNGTTGYGYNDYGRDKIDSIFAEILEAPSAIARTQIISGSHALTVGHFALLRPGDTLLAISGLPYDSLQKVIGIEENPSSLISYGIKYEQIDLVDNEFDEEKILARIKQGKEDRSKKVKVASIQRSRGYSLRNSIPNEKIKKIVDKIKEIDDEVIILVDNCYTEFVDTTSTFKSGADIVIGSLIKNLGGGIAPNGGYIAGRQDLIDLAAERLTVPGQGAEVGPSLGMNRLILQGLYFAPSVVSSAVKTAIFTSALLEELGYDVYPKYDEKRVDIVQAINLYDPELLIKYCQGIQKQSAIDANFAPIPDDMPGYTDKVIMASGSFVSRFFNRDIL